MNITGTNSKPKELGKFKLNVLFQKISIPLQWKVFKFEPPLKILA